MKHFGWGTVVVGVVAAWALAASSGRAQCCGSCGCAPVCACSPCCCLPVVPCCPQVCCPQTCCAPPVMAAAPSCGCGNGSMSAMGGMGGMGGGGHGGHAMAYTPSRAPLPAGRQPAFAYDRTVSRPLATPRPSAPVNAVRLGPITPGPDQDSRPVFSTAQRRGGQPVSEIRGGRLQVSFASRGN